MRDVIVQRFPLHYERYIEVFGGGGWVLFHKPPRGDFEVYNDRNSLLVYSLIHIYSNKLSISKRQIWGIKMPI